VPAYAEKLDPYQRTAALADPASARIVTAGAGSGKTRVFAAAVKHAVETVVKAHGISADCVLAVSFGNAAKRAMMKALEEQGVFGPQVRTYHSLALQLVNKHRSELCRILKEKDAAATGTAAALIPGLQAVQSGLEHVAGVMFDESKPIGLAMEVSLCRKRLLY
jgi:superfamily I DNA/RNA helicase